MMRFARKVSLVAFSLLVVATSASAECAWVLWSNLISSNPASRYAPSTGGLWIPESAGTRAECEKARERSQANAVTWEAMGKGRRPVWWDRMDRHSSPASPTPWTRVGRRGSEEEPVMAKRVKKTKPTVPQIILDMFDFSATSRHVWADESWRLRVAAMMMWHLSRHEADFALREPDRALVIPRGMGNSDLLSVFMLLAGCAIEAIAKGIYMRRKKVKITHGRFPRALQNHDVGGLL